MVKIGFIVEGGTEKIVVESEKFILWLKQQGLELIRPVLDAKGGGNLLPKNIEPMIILLKQQDAKHIVVLTDLEDAPNPQAVKDRIENTHTDLIFVAVKAIESWFLADTNAMRKWLKTADFYEERPEETSLMPWDRLKETSKNLGMPGPGSSKVAFAKKMTAHFDYQVENSAQHSNCSSATFFRNGLASLK